MSPFSIVSEVTRFTERMLVLKGCRVLATAIMISAHARSSLRGGGIRDPRADDSTNVGIVASDRIIPVYPARVESALAPAGAGWIVLAVFAIPFFLSFGLIWFFLGRCPNDFPLRQSPRADDI